MLYLAALAGAFVGIMYGVLVYLRVVLYGATWFWRWMDRRRR